MKKAISIILILGTLLSLAACGEKEAEPLSKKEAKALILEQIKDQEGDPEIVTLTEMGHTWFVLLCRTDGGDIVLRDGYLKEEGGEYILSVSADVSIYSDENGIFDGGWSRDIAFKTVYVRVGSDESITQNPEHKQWSSGLFNKEKVKFYYDVQWD